MRGVFVFVFGRARARARAKAKGEGEEDDGYSVLLERRSRYSILVARHAGVEMCC